MPGIRTQRTTSDAAGAPVEGHSVPSDTSAAGDTTIGVDGTDLVNTNAPPNGTAIIDTADPLNASIGISATVSYAQNDTGGTAVIVSDECVAVCVQGRDHFYERVMNQDVYAANPDFGVYVVADGHGEAGELIAATAVNGLMRSILADIRNTEPGEPAFAMLSRAFASTAAVVNALPEADCSGATASVSFFIGERLYVGNIGDSCVYIVDPVTGGERISTPHQATDAKEAQRVEEDGGIIKYGFMFMPKIPGEKCASLAVTRSFGDRRFPAISFAPAMKEVILSPGQVVVMASDGVWDAHYNFTPSTVCNLVLSEVGDSLALPNPSVGLRQAAVAVLDRSRSIPGKATELPLDDLTLLMVRPIAADTPSDSPVVQRITVTSSIAADTPTAIADSVPPIDGTGKKSSPAADANVDP